MLPVSTSARPLSGTSATSNNVVFDMENNRKRESLGVPPPQYGGAPQRTPVPRTASQQQQRGAHPQPHDHATTGSLDVAYAAALQFVAAVERTRTGHDPAFDAVAVSSVLGSDDNRANSAASVLIRELQTLRRQSTASTVSQRRVQARVRRRSMAPVPIEDALAHLDVFSTTPSEVGGMGAQMLPSIQLPEVSDGRRQGSVASAIPSSGGNSRHARPHESAAAVQMPMFSWSGIRSEGAGGGMEGAGGGGGCGWAAPPVRLPVLSPASSFQGAGRDTTAKAAADPSGRPHVRRIDRSLSLAHRQQHDAAAEEPADGEDTPTAESGKVVRDKTPHGSSMKKPAKNNNRTRNAPPLLKHLGLLETSSIVVVVDVLYVAASAVLWCVAVSGLAIENYHFWSIIAASIAAQVASIAWTALRFFVQTRSGTWEIVAALPEIRAQYRATWFAFDAFCACPIDFVLLLWTPTAFFVAQLRQVVRIVRLVNLTSSSNPLREKRLWLQLYVFLWIVFSLVHTATCIFKVLQKSTYVNALYLTAATMSSVGYGDVVPTNADGNRLFAILIMFVGIGLVASVTAFTTSFMTSRDSLEQSTQEKKQMLASMLEYYRIPWEEQIEIIGLFPTALNAENEKSFTQLVENMPAFIVEKIEGYTRAKQLAESIPLFSELPVSIVLELTSRLHHRFVQANDAIIQHGTEGFEMFFLVRGVADVVVPLSETDELVVAVLRSGQFFGEMALIENTTRTASVFAVVPCELLVLSKPDFEELTSKYAILKGIFMEVVFARHKHKLAAVEHSECAGTTPSNSPPSAHIALEIETPSLKASRGRFSVPDSVDSQALLRSGDGELHRRHVSTPAGASVQPEPPLSQQSAHNTSGGSSARLAEGGVREDPAGNPLASPV